MGKVGGDGVVVVVDVVVRVGFGGGGMGTGIAGRVVVWCGVVVSPFLLMSFLSLSRPCNGRFFCFNPESWSKLAGLGRGVGLVEYDLNLVTNGSAALSIKSVWVLLLVVVDDDIGTKSVGVLVLSTLLFVPPFPSQFIKGDK